MGQAVLVGLAHSVGVALVALVAQQVLQAILSPLAVLCQE